MTMPFACGAEQRLVIAGDAPAVREGLMALMATDMLRGLPEDCRTSAELVMAEVMNNIVEHAYESRGGLIEVALRRLPFGLACRISDSGLPMPGGATPMGQMTGNDAACPADLPEGGFGWGLIRLLARDLAYVRTGGKNHITFLLPLEQSA